MKKTIKKIISILLMLGMAGILAALALPTTIGYAQATPITASASTTAQSGVPGAVLHYAVTIANEDTVHDASITYTTSSARNLVTAAAVPDTSTTSVTVGKNSTMTVIVDVTIPPTATAGQDDIVVLSINESGSFATSISLTVTVTSPNVAANRPQLGVNSYAYGGKPVKAGGSFQLALVIENRGQVSAYNNTVTFSGEGFFPTGTGGMQYIQNIDPSGKITFYQDFQVSPDLAWNDVATITVTAEYNDSSGTKYNNTFTLSIPLTSPYVAATSTPNASLRPQLVITSNSTDIDPLQPGSIFELSLNVKNLGVTDAKSVSMFLGGGTTTTNDSGTPQASVSGSGADLTNFAPLGSSNIIVIGDVPQGSSVTVKQKLVVNVTTAPGAYTLKTSFVYTGSDNRKYVDDQVITLLVYSLPQVEVNFYRDPGTLTAGMPNTLPLQVTNLGKKSTVLGNMKITSPNAEITNNVALVGALDPGGYFTLDAEVSPEQEGTLELDVVINYTDDFNQPREVSQKLSVEVMPAPVFTPEAPNGEEMPVNPAQETFWSKVGRFFKGLLGLDSAVKEPVEGGGGEMMPTESPSSPVIVVPKG